MLGDWADFVRSDAAYRMTQLCRRSGRPFPRLVNDDVVQFCIEEACFERVHQQEAFLERMLDASAAGLDGGDYGEYAEPELADAQSQARAFADGRN